MRPRHYTASLRGDVASGREITKALCGSGGARSVNQSGHRLHRDDILYTVVRDE